MAYGINGQGRVRVGERERKRERERERERENFLELGVNRKLVDNVENYLNMKFQPKILTRSRENTKKPNFKTYFLI